MFTQLDLQGLYNVMEICMHAYTQGTFVSILKEDVPSCY